MFFSKILDVLGSLRLTVICLCLAMVLVFFGTMAQDPLGLYLVQHRFFQSFAVDWMSLLAGCKKTLQMFGIYLNPTTATDVLAAPYIPVFPGGYLLGLLLLVNMAISQYRGFQFSASRIGLYMTHGGLALLLIGQFVTDQMQRESYMRLEEGQPANFSQSDKVSELAVIDTSDAKVDTVTAITERRLRQGGEIAHASLPFTIKITQFYQNSRLTDRGPNATGTPPANQGFGRALKVEEVALAVRTDERNLPTAILEINGPKGAPGTWLVSTMIKEPQRFQYDNKTWELVMRPERHYKAYSINLLKFTHDKYPGTEIPKNFSSRVEVLNPVSGEKRSVLIYMNNPLRYGGETYYQSSFEGTQVSILQVVRNPGYLIPYISCILVGIGLALHFMISLSDFVSNQVKARKA